jgi:hypothetical protein
MMVLRVRHAPPKNRQMQSNITSAWEVKRRERERDGGREGGRERERVGKVLKRLRPSHALPKVLLKPGGLHSMSRPY